MRFLMAATWLIGSAAMAQGEPDDGTGLDPTLPIPTLKYDRPPADFSWDIALQGSYGSIVYWQAEIDPWIGFGLRGSWGKNLTDTGRHRIGVHLLVFIEGPAPVHMTAGIEPLLGWDHISTKGLWVGAGVGPSALYHVKTARRGIGQDASAPGWGLAAAARIGWSQTYTRVGRRLFVGLEPKVRYMNGRVGPTVALMVGSGQGY